VDIRALRYFTAVIEVGTVSRAAEALNIVQPALSRQLSRLEEELGSKLLIRSAKGVVPNEAGRAFYEHAKFILRQIESAKQVVSSKAGVLAGPISIGLAPSTASILGMPLLRAFRERYPDIVLTLIEALSGHLKGQLLSRVVDLAILFSERLPREVESEFLLEERLFLIRRAPSKGRAPGTVTLQQAVAHPLIVPTRAHGLRSELDAAFSQLRLAPKIVAEIDSLPMLMDAVVEGMGATIQPWAALGRIDRKHLRVEQISDADVGRTNYLCSPPSSQLSPTAVAARGLVREIALELVRNREWQGVKV
jgi:LysR family tcuABC transcriptional regulator